MSVLSFGEPLLINYLESNKLTSVSNSYFSLGGSEINTLVSLSNLGRKTCLVSCFPENNFAQEFIDIIEKNKVNTEFIQRSDNEMFGSIYVKDNKIFYQRKNSAFSNLNVYEIEFTKIFNKEIDWLHLTGIPPLVSSNAKIIWKELLRVGIEKNIKISIDFNFKPALGFISDLWSIVKSSIDKIELFIISEDDLNNICKMEQIEIDEKSPEKTLLTFCKKFNVKKGVLYIKRLNSDIQFCRSIMVSDNVVYSSNVKEYTPNDYIGDSDLFSGYLIHGLLNNDKITNILNQADKYVINNQTQRGNFNVKNS